MPFVSCFCLSIISSHVNITRFELRRDFEGCSFSSLGGVLKETKTLVTLIDN